MNVLDYQQCDEVYYLLKKINPYLSKLKKEYPVIWSYTNLMERNLKVCINAEYEGINELTQYLREDWRSIFREEKNIEKIHFRCSDIDEMADINIEIQRALDKIDKILNTNLNDVRFIVKRKWYSVNELMEISKNYSKNVWNNSLIKIVSRYGMLKSPIELIDDDIWTYAFFLGVASNEEEMKLWFHAEIMAYGFLVPMEIIKLKNGSDVLRDLLLSTKTF